MCTPVGYQPLADARWYKKLQAALVAHGSARYERLVEPQKRRLFGALRGRVLEVGAGAGANLPFLAPDLDYVALEPNPFSRDHLRERAAAAGIRAEAVDGAAEALPFPDDAFDGVFCSLVLCTVHDPAAALREIRRVLRPGGRFAFVEHVAAPPGSRTRRVQGAIAPVWQVLGDGCHPDRDTEATLRGVGFGALEVERLRLPLPVVGPHLAGVATKHAP